MFKTLYEIHKSPVPACYLDGLIVFAAGILFSSTTVISIGLAMVMLSLIVGGVLAYVN